MKPKSKTICLIVRLKRCFLFVGLAAGMTQAASAAQFYHINGNTASINSADGELTDDTVNYSGRGCPHAGLPVAANSKSNPTNKQNAAQHTNP